MYKVARDSIKYNYEKIAFTDIYYSNYRLCDI